MRMVGREVLRGLVVLLVATMAWTVHPGSAAAQDPDFDQGLDEEIASLATGPIVRRQLLHRSGRFELQPMAAFTINDPFIRNTLPGVSASYFLNNVFGLGVTANIGALHLDTNLRRSLEETLGDSGLESRGISYSKIQWSGDLALIYVPTFGKFSIMNAYSTHYDIQLMAGVGVIGEGVEAARETITEDEGLSGMRPGGMVGVGLRFFLGDMISLNLQMRNYIAARATISSGAASPQLGNTVILSAGVGIFFPGEVRISR
jgi:outer membrane beta-barrel protein